MEKYNIKSTFTLGNQVVHAVASALAALHDVMDLDPPGAVAQGAAVAVALIDGLSDTVRNVGA